MSESWLAMAAVPVLAYLVGSIPFAFIVGKLRGFDLRTEGTGNVGAGNLRRLAGFPAAAVGGLLDGFKGLFFIIPIRALGLPDPVVVMSALALVAGHNWSVYLRGRSGRGLATAAGVMLAIHPLLLVWPAAWGVAGWWIGGGIAGFIGWTFLPFVIPFLDVPQVALPISVGLAILILLRRMQGNAPALPGWHAAAHRVLFDSEPEASTRPQDVSPRFRTPG